MHDFPGGQPIVLGRISIEWQFLRREQTHFAATGFENASFGKATYARVLRFGEHIRHAEFALGEAVLLDPATAFEWLGGDSLHYLRHLAVKLPA